MFKPNVTKCPYCVGSKNNHRKTLYLYPDTNTYWCARCKAFGNISELGEVDFTLEKKETFTPKLEGFNNSGIRFSVVRERNYNGYSDTFQIKAANGNVTGLHTRKPNKVSQTDGIRNLGFKEPFLTIGETYRIVEGPYDCIYPNDVCTFGFPDKQQAKQLKLNKLILCPDGDVWKEDKNIVLWFRPFLFSKVISVERLPNNKDPDEVPENERKIIDWKDIKRWIWKKC